MLEVDLIADYLVENLYASNIIDAYRLIPCISDEWMDIIIEEVESLIVEMRKEDKVKGKTKTPLYLGSKSNTRVEKVRKSDDDYGWKVTKATTKTPNIAATIGRAKQGMPLLPSKDTGFSSVNRRAYSQSPRYEVRHPHGGGEPGVTAGEARGVKKRRGVRTKISPSKTSVGQIKNRLKTRELRREAKSNIDPIRDKGVYSSYKDPSPKDLITRYPKLNLPEPPKKSSGPRVARKTAMNKMGKAKTGTEILKSLNKMSKS